MLNISISIQNLIRAAMEEEKSREIPRHEPLISVPVRTSRASFIYERMRTAVDYKEEHLIRRNAIERILRRLIGTGKKKNLAELLITELIHARYLANDTIPQRNLEELEKIFAKYFVLIGHAHGDEMSRKETLAGWTLGVMATEVDEFLKPPHVMHASINAMYEFISSGIHMEEKISEKDIKEQIYISVSRMLYKNDNDTLRYHLFLTFYPDWNKPDQALIREVGENLTPIRETIEAKLAHPVKEKLNTAIRKHIAYFIILKEVITASPEEAWNAMHHENDLTALIKKTCDSHYTQSRSRLKRSIARSVIYLILTKFLLAFVLEIPIEYWLLGDFEGIPLLINLLFPPILLIIIARSTKLPDQENTRVIAQGIRNIIFGNEDIIQLPKTKKRGFIISLIFVISYAVLFVFSFGLLVSILQALSFSVIGILVFLFFLCLVSLFAYRIRRSVRELLVMPPKSGLLKSLFSFFSIPILHAGKWVSTKFAKINIFIFILDFVIEAPFKSFMKITEEWMDYVHEKKEEI